MSELETTVVPPVEEKEKLEEREISSEEKLTVEDQEKEDKFSTVEKKQTSEDADAPSTDEKDSIDSRPIVPGVRVLSEKDEKKPVDIYEPVTTKSFIQRKIERLQREAYASFDH